MAKITMREAISQALMEEMDRDPSVFILGEEVGVWGGTYAVTKGFYDKYGAARVKDTPIAENAIIGAAIGAAMVGQRPIAELMTINFAFSAMDYIVNQAPKLHYMFGGQFTLPMVIRAVGGGGRQLGATHSQTPDAIFAHFPGLKVVSPGTPEDAKGLLKSAIRSNDPILFIEHATMYQVRGDVPEGEYTVPIGKSKVQREGNDVTIVTYCKGLELSMKAADDLSREGIEAEIVDLRTLRPLDMEPVLESFKKTNRAIVVEEGWKSYGVGSEIVSRIYEEAFDYVDAPILRVAQKEVPLPYNRTLEQAALPQVPDIVAAVKEGLEIMAETINMPKLGFDMAEGLLVRWVKQVGENINKGDVLAEIETDKATVEVESSASGVVLQLIVDQGTVVPVNAPIAVIGQAGEVVSEHASRSVSSKKVVDEKPATPPSGTMPTPPTSAPVQPGSAPLIPGPLKASPLAKKIAKDNRVDLSRVQGTGPGGRIVRKDIEAALSSGQPKILSSQPASIPGSPIVSHDDQLIQTTKLRQAIGRRLVESKTTIPHFYVTHEFKMDSLMDIRKQVNEYLPDNEKLSVNDFILKGVALSLRQFPNLNATIKGAEVIQFGHVNIGVAVTVPGGLMTVVVRDADQKPLRQISSEVKIMAGRAREGKVKPEDVDGSTFSTSNLGMYDVEDFIAIINPPEAAILAISSAREVPVIENGQVRPGWRMKATVSVDHRVSDGAEAAQFMQALAKYLEEPLRLVI